jgi:hypothetical protein
MVLREAGAVSGSGQPLGGLLRQHTGQAHRAGQLALFSDRWILTIRCVRVGKTRVELVPNGSWEIREGKHHLFALEQIADN